MDESKSENVNFCGVKKLRLVIGVPSIFLALIGAGIVDPLVYVYRSIIAQCMIFCTNKNTPLVRAGYCCCPYLWRGEIQKPRDFNFNVGARRWKQTCPAITKQPVKHRHGFYFKSLNFCAVACLSAGTAMNDKVVNGLPSLVTMFFA